LTLLQFKVVFEDLQGSNHHLSSTYYSHSGPVEFGNNNTNLKFFVNGNALIIQFLGNKLNLMNLI